MKIKYMKYCHKCNTNKDESLFMKNKRNKNGLGDHCLECNRIKNRKWYSRNGKKYKQANKEKIREAQKIYFNTKRGKILRAKNDKAMILKYPEKYLARLKLRNALRKNEIKKLPCEMCDSLKTEGHHDDYTKPLNVRWFCREHHREYHQSFINRNLSS